MLVLVFAVIPESLLLLGILKALLYILLLLLPFLEVSLYSLVDVLRLSGRIP